MVKLYLFCLIQLKFRFWVHKNRWRISCTFQLEIEKNKKISPKNVWQTYMKWAVVYEIRPLLSVFITHIGKSDVWSINRFRRHVFRSRKNKINPIWCNCGCLRSWLIFILFMIYVNDITAMYIDKQINVMYSHVPLLQGQFCTYTRTFAWFDA